MLTEQELDWFLPINREKPVAAGDVAIKIAKETGKRQIVTGLENIRHSGGYILVMNHFVSDKSLSLAQRWTEAKALYGTLLYALQPTMTEDQKVMLLSSIIVRSNVDANDPLREKTPFPFFERRKDFFTMAPDVIPVYYSEEGKRNVFREVAEHLHAENIIALFPEEGTSPTVGRAKTGFSRMAIASNAPVYPVAMYSTPTDMFVSIGKAQIPPKRIEGKDMFANQVMFSLAEMLPPLYRGFYSHPERQSRRIVGRR